MIESADLHKYLPTLAFAVDLESTRIKGQRRVPRLHRDGSQQLPGHARPTGTFSDENGPVPW